MTASSSSYLKEIRNLPTGLCPLVASKTRYISRCLTTASTCKLNNEIWGMHGPRFTFTKSLLMGKVSKHGWSTFSRRVLAVHLRNCHYSIVIPSFSDYTFSATYINTELQWATSVFVFLIRPIKFLVCDVVDDLKPSHWKIKNVVEM